MVVVVLYLYAEYGGCLTQMFDGIFLVYVIYYIVGIWTHGIHIINKYADYCLFVW